MSDSSFSRLREPDSREPGWWKLKLKRVIFFIPQTAVGITDIYIYSSVGQDHSSLKNYFLSPLNKTIFALYLLIPGGCLQLSAACFIPSSTYTLSTVITVLLLLATLQNTAGYKYKITNWTSAISTVKGFKTGPC